MEKKENEKFTTIVNSQNDQNNRQKNYSKFEFSLNQIFRLILESTFLSFVGLCVFSVYAYWIWMLLVSLFNANNSWSLYRYWMRIWTYRMRDFLASVLSNWNASKVAFALFIVVWQFFSFLYFYVIINRAFRRRYLKRQITDPTYCDCTPYIPPLKNRTPKETGEYINKEIVYRLLLVVHVFPLAIGFAIMSAIIFIINFSVFIFAFWISALLKNLLISLINRSFLGREWILNPLDVAKDFVGFFFPASQLQSPIRQPLFIPWILVSAFLLYSYLKKSEITPLGEIKHICPECCKCSSV